MPRFSHKWLILSIGLALGIATYSPSVLAKCQTVRIDIEIEKPSRSLEISDAAIVEMFNFWNGPGVRVNDKPVHLDPNRQQGHFIDWPAGPITDFPADGESYAISFLCDVEKTDHPRIMYEVDYVFRPGVDGGYIHLPGFGDDRYGPNVSTIVHDVEGMWFRSSANWEQLIRPIISNAIEIGDETT